MDSHSIGSRPSATTGNNATKLSNDARPASGPSRRAMLAGMAALPLSACPAPAPAHAAGVSAKLAELIDVARDANAEQARFYSEVYNGHEEREIAARLAGGAPCPIPGDVTSRDNELCAASTEAETRVMNWPATTPADFHAKIAAMVAFGLFNVADQSRNMLADAARLAGMEA